MSVAHDNRYGERLEKVERATELPMLALALFYVPVFVIGYLRDVPPDVQAAARLVGLLIICAFVVELAVKIAVARNRLTYLRTHWLSVLIVVVPFLRPLRILRIIPLLAKGTIGVRTILERYHGLYVLFVGVLSVLMSAFLVFVFERGAGGTIRTFSGALWWAAQTVTAVGYGDVVPVTTSGQVVATLLMVVGIALFGVLTAGVAAYFVHDPSRETRNDDAAKVLEKLDSLEARLSSLEARLEDPGRDRGNP